MRRDIKKRLEKALITLQEPGGSTIRSIIKVINKDSPVLSLRKVLEALQEGINEGFLCMYNGRFKLKQQTCPANSSKQDVLDCEDFSDEEKDLEEIPRTSESDLFDEESDFESDGENHRSFNLKNALILKKNVSKRLEEPRVGRKSNARPSRNVIASKKGKTRSFSKCKNSKSRGREAKSRMRKGKKWSKEKLESGCDSLLEMTPGFSKQETGHKGITEKPDVKKQRGPRCTSMKKDVRMPSRVHIPFAPPTVPQRSNFNELFRRSPEPVNGPLFDCHKDLSLMPENLGFFGTYC